MISQNRGKNNQKQRTEFNNNDKKKTITRNNNKLMIKITFQLQ